LFGEGPTRIPAGQFSDNEVTFTGQDIRFTAKGDTLFAIILGEPGKVVEINSLTGEKVKAVKMPGESLSWSQSDQGLKIDVPEKQTGRHAWVFEIELDRGL
jgi:alpha-L-fucosidase